MSLENEIKNVLYKKLRRLYNRNQVHLKIFREGEQDFPTREELINFKPGLFIYYRLPSEKDEIKIDKMDIRRMELRQLLKSVKKLSKEVYNFFGKGFLTIYFFGKEEIVKTNIGKYYRFKCKYGFKIGDTFTFQTGKFNFFAPKRKHLVKNLNEEALDKLCKKIVNCKKSIVDILLDPILGNKKLKETIKREVENLKKRDEIIENIADPTLRKLMKMLINDQKHSKGERELLWNGKHFIVRHKEEKFFE